MTLFLPLWIALCGALGVKAVDRQGFVGWPLAAVLGPAMGFGGLSLVYFFCRLAGVTGAQFRVLGWLLLIVVPALALRHCLARPPLGPRSPSASPRFTTSEWLALVLLLLGFVLAIAALVLYARQRPHGTFDAWAIWTSRARLLYRGTDLAAIFAVLRKAHPDYPLLIPGSLAAQFTLVGSESARLPQLTGGLFTLATLGGVGLAVHRLSGDRAWAALAAALLAATPMFLFWGGSQCADLPLACILLLTVVALAALLDRERAPWLPAGAAGFLLGLLAWTKNEGMPLTLILLTLFAAGAWWTGRRALLVPVLAGALPPWLAALLFRWLWAPQTDLGHFAGDLFARLAEPTRWRVVGEAFALRLDPIRGFDSWGVVWLAAGLALLVGGRLHRAVDPALRFSRWVLLAVWLAWFGVFVGTPLDLAWHLETALDRLLLQLLPLTLTVGAASLALASKRRPGAAGRRAILLGVLISGLVGCRSTPEDSVPQRLIAEPPSERLVVDQLMHDEVAAQWPFSVAATAADDSTWRAGPGTAAETADGLRLTPGEKGRASLQRRVALDAAAVDVLRLELAGASGGTLALMWAGPEEPFGVERRIELDLAEYRGAAAATATFLVGGHAKWTDRVERLRLDYTQHRSQQPLEVRSLRAARRLHDDSALAAAADRAWRVEVDHERRDAFVAAPDQPLVWRLPESAAGQLRYGFACAGAAVGTTTFRVFRDRASTPLFEARVGAADREAGRWFDIELPLDAVHGARELRFEVEYPAGERRALAFWSAPELAPGGRSTRPDILLVSVDTLRPDRLSLYGAERQTSPQLDAWAASAVVFDKVVSSAPWTLPAHISLFSGRDALAHGVNHRSRVPTALPLVTEALRAAGYATWAITGGGYLDPDYGLDRGFDRYRYWPEHTGEEELEAHLETAFEWLDDAPEQPLFLFFHTYEVHHPYRPRQPYFARFTAGRDAPPAGALGYVNLPQTEAEGFELTKQWRRQDAAGERLPLDGDAKRRLVDLYDSGVAYADAQLARLLKRWAAHDEGDRSVVVITSDHGEALGEKDLAGHAYVDDFNALVPLILRLPGGRHAGRVAAQVRLLDLAPTLADLAGLEPAGPTDGLSLVPLAEEGGGEHRPAWLYAGFANRGLALRLSDRWKYVYNDTAWPALQGREALFDLRRDPSESVDLSTEDEARTAPLRELARTQIAGVASAIRISLVNHGAEPVGGRLVGAVLQPSRLKSPQLSPGAVGRIPGGAALRAAPGETLILFLASPGPGNLAVSLEPRFKESVALAALDRPWRAVLDGAGWRLLATDDSGAGAAPAATLTIEWATAGGAVAADPAAENADLRRQLEALGYIE